MELETKLPVPDKEARRVIEDNFQKIQDEINKISQSEERLTKRITALEDMLFGQHPQEVKMAENSTPPVNGGAMLVNLTNKGEK